MCVSVFSIGDINTNTLRERERAFAERRKNVRVNGQTFPRTLGSLAEVVTCLSLFGLG